MFILQCYASGNIEVLIDVSMCTAKIQKGRLELLLLYSPMSLIVLMSI